jgi:16S rRNA (guanine(966)-N(2))-methyltransferase RsmD
VRVIGGTARGRRLAAPRGERVRPTADRVKEALFSILTSLLGNLEGLRVLDIFAGTGNLGIEALSRGCGEAIFVDSHRESAAVIRQNLTQLGLADRSRVIVKEAASALQGLDGNTAPFHIIFLDPPYRLGLAEKILVLLATSPLVAEATIIVVESDSDEELPEGFGPLRQFDRRVYGDTALTFFQKGTPDDHA